MHCMAHFYLFRPLDAATEEHMTSHSRRPRCITAFTMSHATVDQGIQLGDDDVDQCWKPLLQETLFGTYENPTESI